MGQPSSIGPLPISPRTATRCNCGALLLPHTWTLPAAAFRFFLLGAFGCRSPAALKPVGSGLHLAPRLPNRQPQPPACSMMHGRRVMARSCLATFFPGNDAAHCAAASPSLFNPTVSLHMSLTHRRMLLTCRRMLLTDRCCRSPHFRWMAVATDNVVLRKKRNCLCAGTIPIEPWQVPRHARQGAAVRSPQTCVWTCVWTCV